jgi:hypothetical protein
MKKFLGVLAALTLAGCGSSHSSGASSTTVTLPSWTVAPGTELLKCVYKSLHNPEDRWVQEFDTTQIEGGHHIAAYLSITELPDGTEVDCASPQSMESFRPLLIGLDKNGFALPEHYAVRIPANATIVYQSHYINATTAPINTLDKVKIHFVSRDAQTIPAGTFAFSRISFNIPAGETVSTSEECTVPSDMKVFTMFGHMHEWGKAVSIEAGPTADSMTTIYDVQHWTAQMRDSPPHYDFGFETPMQLHTGDHVRLNCTWENHTSDPIGFPKEMCAGVLWFFPAEESPICGD